jgi:hypothetical protein
MQKYGFFIIFDHDLPGAESAFCFPEVGADKDRTAIPVPVDQVEVPVDAGFIEVGGRFIEQKKRSVAQDGAHQFDTLLHPRRVFPDRFGFPLGELEKVGEAGNRVTLHQGFEREMEPEHFREGEFLDEFLIRRHERQIPEYPGIGDRFSGERIGNLTLGGVNVPPHDLEKG